MLMEISKLNNNLIKTCLYHQLRVYEHNVSYIQGQNPDDKIREYFYYVDHQGMLFLDDTKIKNFTSCLKDKKILSFFFKRLRVNDTDRYRNFPYLSLCGHERNYVRCDDLPIVFTEIVQKTNKEKKLTQEYLSYNYGHELLMVPFEPTKIVMSLKTFRVYHPGPNLTGGIGLIKSSLAIKFSSFFIFNNGENNGPTYFYWQGTKHKIDSNWYKEKISKNQNIWKSRKE